MGYGSEADRGARWGTRRGPLLVTGGIRGRFFVELSGLIYGRRARVAALRSLRAASGGWPRPSFHGTQTGEKAGSGKKSLLDLVGSWDSSPPPNTHE